jgi:hypothetical protein
MSQPHSRNEKIACHVTVRGEKAEEILQKVALLHARPYNAARNFLVVDGGWGCCIWMA